MHPGFDEDYTYETVPRLINTNFSTDSDGLSDVANRQGHQGGFEDAVLSDQVLFRNRIYSVELLRWLTEDPIGYVDGVNVYQFVRSSPVRYTDSLGLMPNKADAITLDELIAEVEKVESWNPSKRDKQDELLDDVAWHFSNSYWKYIYTDRHNWIDLPHFFTAASWFRGTTRIGTLLVEHGQYVQKQTISRLGFRTGSGASAYGVEDWTSNRQGGYFRYGLKVGANCLKLSEQVRAAFEYDGAKRPQDALNFYALPPTEAQWQYEVFELSWLAEGRIRAFKNPQSELPWRYTYENPPSGPATSSSGGSSGASSGASGSSGGSGASGSSSSS